MRQLIYMQIFGAVPIDDEECKARSRLITFCCHYSGEIVKPGLSYLVLKGLAARVRMAFWWHVFGCTRPSDEEGREAKDLKAKGRR